METICPHCGYALDENAVAFGRLFYSPRLGVCLDGVRMKMSPQCHDLCGMLMKSQGLYITRLELENKLNYHGRGNLLCVLLTQLRRALTMNDVPFVIESSRGRGLRFISDTLMPKYPS